MKLKENYAYRCVFKKEILVNREQEYIRKSKHSCEFEDYESEFEDTDFQDAKRWIIDTTISFYAKNEEEIINRIRFEFHNARIDTDPIIEGDYFYWFDNNCLVNQERLLYRAYLTVDYACDVSVTEEDMKIIANRKEG